MDLRKHNASKAGKILIANFEDSIRIVSISQFVCISIHHSMFVSGSGSSLPTELRFAREPVLVADLVRYDVFVCFCAFVIVCLCLLYCDYVIRVFEYIFEYEVGPVASCCFCMLLLFEVWRWKSEVQPLPYE